MLGRAPGSTSPSSVPRSTWLRVSKPSPNNWGERCCCPARSPTSSKAISISNASANIRCAASTTRSSCLRITAESRPTVEHGEYGHKKERLEPLFLVLYARTPLTIVAHILPGRPVIIRPTLGAMGSGGLARYERAGACLSTAEPTDVHQTATTDAVKFHGEGRGGNC